MSYSFKNKVVIITGSNLGIGKSTAIELARQGARIVLNGRTPERLNTTREQIEKMNTAVLAVQAEVTSYSGCVELMEKTVTMLVNAALIVGIFILLIANAQF